MSRCVPTRGYGTLLVVPTASVAPARAPSGPPVRGGMAGTPARFFIARCALRRPRRTCPDPRIPPAAAPSCLGLVFHPLCQHTPAQQPRVASSRTRAHLARFLQSWGVALWRGVAARCLAHAAPCCPPNQHCHGPPRLRPRERASERASSNPTAKAHAPHAHPSTHTSTFRRHGQQQPRGHGRRRAWHGCRQCSGRHHLRSGRGGLSAVVDAAYAG